MSVLSALLLFAGLCALAPATTSGATQRPLRGAGTAAVGMAALVPPGAADLGLATPSARLSIDVVLQPRNAAALDAFVAGVSDPSSPLYGHYLAKGEFGRVFGATPATVTAVSASLRAAGLHVGPVSANDLLLPVTTSVAGAEAAFDVSMHAFRTASGAVMDANTTAPRLPSSIAPSVQSVVGLDDLTPAAPEDIAASAPRTTAPALGGSSRLASGQDAACGNAIATADLTAGDIAQAYDFGPLYNAGDFGANKSIDLFELSGFPVSDVATYQRCYGTHVAITYEPEDGGNSSTTGNGALEADSDIEDVIGLDPALRNVLVYEAPNTPTGVLADYTQIQVNDGAPVVSTSWGQCESFAQADGLTGPESTLFSAMAAQHQTVFAASGDQGSEGCSNEKVTPRQTQLAVDDPASQPDVTGVGGTDITNAGNPPLLAPSETAWTGAGGGISSLYARPSWQSGKGVINSYSSGSPCGDHSGVCREVPDVAAVAGTNYAVYNQGKWIGVFGTSLAAPDWAALTALMDDSSSSCRSTSLGFLNPRLYSLATSTPADFNDITKGDNDALGLHKGAYPATGGYDMVTGLGTPVGANLAQSLCGGTLWTAQTTATNMFTSAAPSVASSGRTLYVTFVNSEPDSSASYVYFVTFNGTTWGKLQTVRWGGTHAESHVSPSIAIDKGAPVIAWTDFTTSDVEVSSLSGGKWSKPVVIGGGKALSSTGPAITSYGGEIFAVWKGHSGNSVWFSIDTGSSWTAQETVPGASTGTRPAITFFPSLGAAVVSWATTSKAIRYEVYSLFGFGGVADIPGGTSAGPALAVVGNRLYVAFKGKTSDHVWYSADTPGKLYGGSWTGARQIPQALTVFSPALTATGPTLYSFWIGQSATSTSDAKLWYAGTDPPQ